MAEAVGRFSIRRAWTLTTATQPNLRFDGNINLNIEKTLAIMGSKGIVNIYLIIDVRLS
jgi:hypothetical protein